MNLLELLLIAVGLSMDAFAVSVSTGLTMPQATIKKSLTVGLYFGIFQAVMPLLGYLLATQFADNIIAFDHWIAFILLCFIGGKMALGSFDKEGDNKKRQGGEASLTASLTPGRMLPLAVATSIDALAVGVSFAFLQVKIGPAVCYIGLTTLILSMAGVKIGHAFGAKFKSQAELAGGLILVLIGLKILLEHLGIFSL